MEGMRGRRPTSEMLGGVLTFAHLRAFWRPLVRGRPGRGAGDRTVCGIAGVGRVWPWDELESLILAQNERWRHA
jgi:hypothetical protein